MKSKTIEASPLRQLIARFSVVVAACLCLAAPRADGGESPKAVVEATTSQVLEVLRNDALAKEQKQTQIEEIVYAKVDFATVSRLVLARNWKRLSADQQTLFVAEFKKHLSITYRDNVDKYRNETVRITGDRKEARGDWAVMTKVVGGRGASDFLVNYRLRQKEGRWWIIDIIIEGVSMVSNFRSQFQEIMATGGPERLLRLLKEKNAAHQSLASS
jgi:phospholipid transport system substrate-binding protein